MLKYLWQFQKREDGCLWSCKKRHFCMYSSYIKNIIDILIINEKFLKRNANYILRIFETAFIYWILQSETVQCYCINPWRYLQTPNQPLSTFLKCENPNVSQENSPFQLHHPRLITKSILLFSRHTKSFSPGGSLCGKRSNIESRWGCPFSRLLFCNLPKKWGFDCLSVIFHRLRGRWMIEN